jgi:hypothetical protein
MAQTAPHMVIKLVSTVVESAPEVAARVKEDIVAYAEERKAAKAKAKASPRVAAQATM